MLIRNLGTLGVRLRSHANPEVNIISSAVVGEVCKECDFTAMFLLIE